MSLDQELLAQIDKYKEILQKNPDSREFLTLADLYRKLGVAEEATNILRDGLKKHPSYVDARVAIARIFLTQGQVADATREFEEVIRQDVNNFVAYKLLGEIAMQKQEHEKAAERFGAAYALKPDDQECKVMLDYIGSLLGRDLTANLGAPAAIPQPAQKPTKPLAASGETIAVAPGGEFEEFETVSDVEEMSALAEEVESFEEAEELGDVEEFGDLEEPEALADIEDLEEIGDIEEFEEEPDELAMPEEVEEEPGIFEEEMPEEILEEPEAGDSGDFEIDEFTEQEPDVVAEAEEILSGDDGDAQAEEEFTEIEEFAEGDLEAIAEEPMESFVEEPAGGEEELVAQIFQELSDSEYTSKTNGGALDSSETELEDLMGMLESEEAEEAGQDVGIEEHDEEAKDDLEGMLDLEGVPGIEELGKEEVSAFEEAEEFEEVDELEDVDQLAEDGAEIEDLEDLAAPENFQEIGASPEIEEFEEIEGIEEMEAPEEDGSSVEQETPEEESSIFQDFGLPEEEEGEPKTKEGDVFQDFDFDVFEQELLKDHPSQETKEPFAEPGPEELLAEEEDVIAEEIEPDETEAVLPEDVEELPEEIEALEEFGEEETETEASVSETELPASSLAELYIKQDLFDEATNIYRKILRQTPSDKMIRQMLEETLALRAYVEGSE